MRDFLEYVERSKENSPNTLDFYIEGFSSDLSKIEGVDPTKTFILGYLAGKGVDIIKENHEKIMDLLTDKEIISFTEAIAELKTDDNTNIKDLRTSLSSILASFRNALKEENKVLY
jgi:hypothetical protein